MYANIISVMFSLGFFLSGEQSKDSNKPECATIMMVRCDCFCFQFETQRKKENGASIINKHRGIIHIMAGSNYLIDPDH